MTNPEERLKQELNNVRFMGDQSEELREKSKVFLWENLDRIISFLGNNKNDCETQGDEFCFKHDQIGHKCRNNRSPHPKVNDELVVVVQFYADMDNYRGSYCGDGSDGPLSNVSADNGMRAREALAKALHPTDKETSE